MDSQGLTEYAKSPPPPLYAKGSCSQKYRLPAPHQSPSSCIHISTPIHTSAAAAYSCSTIHVGGTSPMAPPSRTRLAAYSCSSESRCSARATRAANAILQGSTAGKESMASPPTCMRRQGTGLYMPMDAPMGHEMRPRRGHSMLSRCCRDGNLENACSFTTNDPEKPISPALLLYAMRDVNRQDGTPHNCKESFYIHAGTSGAVSLCPLFWQPSWAGELGIAAPLHGQAQDAACQQGSWTVPGKHAWSSTNNTDGAQAAEQGAVLPLLCHQRGQRMGSDWCATSRGSAWGVTGVPPAGAAHGE